MKAGLALIGVPTGEVRPPWQGLTEQETSELAYFLRGTLLARQMASPAGAVQA
jgi:hypothetical protein